MFFCRQHENGENECAGDEHLDEDSLCAVNSLRKEGAVGRDERQCGQARRDSHSLGCERSGGEGVDDGRSSNTTDKLRNAVEHESDWGDDTT